MPAARVPAARFGPGPTRRLLLAAAGALLPPSRARAAAGHRPFGIVLPACGPGAAASWAATGWSAAWQSPLSLGPADLLGVVADPDDARRIPRGWTEALLGDDPEGAAAPLAALAARYGSPWAAAAACRADPFPSAALPGVGVPRGAASPAFRLVVLARGADGAYWLDLPGPAGGSWEDARASAASWLSGLAPALAPPPAGIPAAAGGDGGLPVLGAPDGGDRRLPPDPADGG